MWTINFWLDAGCPRDRLVVGLPTYGMSFTLKNAHSHGLRAPVLGGGEPGRYTGEKGIMSYYEV